MIRSASPRRRSIRRAVRWAGAGLLALGVLLAGPQRAGLGSGRAEAYCVVVPGVAGCVRGAIIRRRIERRRRAAGSAAVDTGRIAPAPVSPSRVRPGRSSSPRLKSSGAQLTRIDPAVQTALNTLGFAVGRADGLLGRKTRDGIRDFQRAIDHKATGTLSVTERTLLMRAEDEALAQNIAMPAGGDPVFLRNVAAAAAPATVAAAAQVADAAAPSGDAPPPPATAEDGPGEDAPSPQADAPEPASREIVEAAVCRDVETDVDAAELATLRPDAAMRSAYCGVRAYVVDIVDPDTLGADDGRADLATCAAWADRTGLGAAQAAALGPDDVAPAFSSRIPEARDELASARDVAKTCIGLAFRHDDPGTARFYALYAVAMGDTGYGELIAAQHGLGTGVAPDPDAAAQWYDWTAEALLDGADTVTGDDARLRSRLLRVLAAKADTMAPFEADPGIAPADAPTPDSSAEAAPSDLPQLARLLDVSPAELTALCEDPGDDPIARRVCRLGANPSANAGSGAGDRGGDGPTPPAAD